MALVAVVVVSMLATVVITANGVVARRLEASIDRKLSFYTAEAGLAEAYAGLLIGKTGNVGTRERPAAFGQGLFWVEATTEPDGSVELKSTGMVGNGLAVLSLVAVPGTVGVAELGVFSEAALTVQPGAVIDGYDSSEGSYESQVLGGLAPLGAGRLGSNAAVVAEGLEALPTILNAEVLPGPGEVLRATRSVEHYGAVEPARNPVSLPASIPPTGTTRRGIVHESAVPLVLQSGTHHLDGLQVGPGAEARIEGPSTLVLGSLRLEPEATLVLDPTDGPIDVFVTRELELDSGSFATVLGSDPSRVRLHVGEELAEPARLASNAAFQGVVYAPESQLRIEAPFQVFGAVVAKQLDLSGAVRLHFDRNLARVSLESSLPKLLSWRIVKLGDRNGVALDPFSALGLDRTTLPTPAEAHADQLLHVEYWDQAGLPLVYDGLESGFDWTNVLDVQELLRDGRQVADLDPLAVKLPPADLALIDLIEGDAAARDVTRALLDASPLSAAVVEAAMTTSDPLLSDHYRRILVANSPLPPRPLEIVLRNDPPLMSAFDLAQVLAAQ